MIQTIAHRLDIRSGKTTAGPSQTSALPTNEQPSVLAEMATMMKMMKLQMEQSERMMNLRLEQMERRLTPPPTNPMPTPQVQAQQPPPPPPTRPTDDRPSRRTKFPDPERFNGNRDVYPTFRYQVQAKLEADYEGQSERMKLNYVMGRTTGHASKVLLPWLTSYGTHATLRELWDLMDQQFGDPHHKTRALNRLYTIRQGKRSIRDFQVEFSRLLLESGENFRTAAKKNMFLSGLNSDVQKSLVSVLPTMSFEEFVNETTRIADYLHQVDYLKNQHYRSSNSHAPRMNRTPSPPTASADTMEWEPSRSGTQRAQWVLLKEINERRDKGVCLRCGKPGHLIATCKLRPALNPNAPARSTKADTGSKLRKTLDDASTVVESDDDSGKE